MTNILPLRYPFFAQCLAAGLLSASSSMAGGGPENVFLVVNASSEASRTVANHYIDLRKIPPPNVFYLKYPAGRVAVPGSVFRSRILEPILKEIEKRKLSGQIDYVVYSCDFPWRVDFRKDFPDEKFQRTSNPVASLSAATYLYAFVLGKRKEMFGTNTNFYCSPPADLVVVSRACRSTYRWAPGGQRAGEGGIPYMMSSVLGINSTPGNTIEEIASYLERAAKADGTQPKGTIYFAVNKDIRSKVREKSYQAAVRSILLSGVEAQIIQEVFPQYKQNVAGVTCGAGLVNPVESHSRLLPGAFIDNLTSAGGQFLPDKGQTCISEFLRIGAAGANGTVVEPLAIPQKFPNNTLHVHYVHGCSLAESFYQSVAGPFQQILIGDPLCQPWAKIPKVNVAGVTDGAMVRDLLELIPSAADTQASIASFQLFVDGDAVEKCVPGERIKLDTAKLADGHHELRVVATDNTPMETQGRWMGSVVVKNGTDAVQLSVDDKSLAPGIDSIKVQVTTTNHAPTAVLANGTEVGRVENGEGSISIDDSKLGSGPVTLVAVTEGRPGLRSRPVRITLTTK